MLDEPPDPPPRLLFGKITPGNAHATINRVAIAWYAVVAIQIFRIGTNFGISQLPYLVVSLHLWSAAGAYFVCSRKSRVAAIAQFAYVALVAFTALFPYVPDGTPLSNVLRLLQVIFMGWVAWRGAHATWVHHRAANLRTEWKHVVAVLGLMAIAIPVTLVGTAVAFQFMHSDADSFAVVRAVKAAVASFPLIMGLLTWKYPFAGRDTVKHVAEVFE